MNDTPGKTFGKYEAIGQLGAGAMGVVWRAKDPVLGRTVAIKTISASLAADDENKQRFLREAQAAAQLNHPNIITVHDFGQADSELYMAMELLEGKDLKELIVAGTLSFEEKLEVMEQVADGLAYAHSREVVHRDLKPGNIHVQPNGQVKILDFGLARLGGSNLTKTGVVMGTPNYMSPEQVMGARVDERSDVFSAGAVFYELLTGRKPFDADSIHATLYQVVHNEPPPPRQWDPKLPQGLVAIVETAMAKSAERRYRNGAALRDAIHGFRYGEAPPSVEIEGVTDASTTMTHDPDATAVTPASSVTRAPKPGAFRGHGRPSSSASASRLPRPSASQSGARPSAAPAPPVPPRSPGPLLVVAILALTLVVAFVGYGVLNRGGGAPAQSSIDALTANLVETQLDLARRVLDDKDYKGAIEQTSRTLKLDPRNPEALALREQAQGALREIETSVAAAREAVSRGDSVQATAALERVMARDPRNPVVAELSSQLNANFAARAADAQGDMQKAKAAAAKAGANGDPAFAEAETLAATAARTLEERQFTTATQTFLQARDAYDRARRSVQNRPGPTVPGSAATPPVRSAADGARSAATSSTPAPPSSVPRAPAATPTQAAVLPAPVATPEAPAPVAAPVAEDREFLTGPTKIQPAALPEARQPKGFSTAGMAIQEFTGRYTFEVLPAALVPGAPYRVRVFLRNEGNKGAKIEALAVKISRNGEASSPAVRILEDDVKTGQAPLVTEVSGTWLAGTTSWSLEIEALSRKGERFRGSLAMKQP